MKITDKILSIPPFISTTWGQVRSLTTLEKGLLITLEDSSQCLVPNLSPEIIGKIFEFHSQSLERQSHGSKETNNPLAKSLQSSFQEILATICKLGSETISSIGKIAQHDPSHSHFPDLPSDVIEKVRLFHQVLSKEEILSMPPPEDDCNCMYCQISRILREPYGSSPTDKEVDHLEEKDLEFSEWIIEPIGDQLYRVINKLDPTEEYRVFLGNPIGCTCGKQNCEHILAVLKS